MPSRTRSWMSRSSRPAGWEPPTMGVRFALRFGSAAIAPPDDETGGEMDAAEAAGHQRVAPGGRRREGGGARQQEGGARQRDDVMRVRAGGDDARAVEQQPGRRKQVVLSRAR